MLVIWRKLDDNTLWWCTDSGCSCPVPFDPAESFHDLKQITSDTYYNFKLAVENHYEISKSDINEILSAVSGHLRHD
jgi:hypothetical protein